MKLKFLIFLLLLAGAVSVAKAQTGDGVALDAGGIKGNTSCGDSFVNRGFTTATYYDSNFQSDVLPNTKLVWTLPSTGFDAYFDITKFKVALSGNLAGTYSDFFFPPVIDAANHTVTVNFKTRAQGALWSYNDSYLITLFFKNIAVGDNQNGSVALYENNGLVGSTTITPGDPAEVTADPSCLTATNDVYGVVTPGTTTTTSIYANDVSIYGTWTDPVTGVVTTYRPNGTYGPNEASSQTPINVITTITDDGGLTGVTLNQDGTLNIPANAAPGSYTLTYSMCSSEDNTIQCKTAQISLTILGVDAVDDPNFATFNAGTGGISTASVLANDKYTDGTTPTSANVTVSAYNNNTSWPAGITIDADGKITVNSTVAAGTYNLEYQICNKNNSADCDVATATVQVNGLTANPDNGSATQGIASTPVANVVANDQYNGATPVIGTANGQVTISQSGTWPAGFSLNTSTGAVSVTAAVAAGTYTMDYQECVNGASPALCKTTTVTIVVSGPAVCYNPVTNTTAGTPVNHGITLLKRAGADNGNWPMNRNSAHTALESNTKGFVITRVPTSGLSAITNPVEGMMVYDTTAKCLKIYVVDNTVPANTGWKCFSTPACP